MTPEDFYYLCVGHDWHYERSESQAVWREGHLRAQRIASALKAQPTFRPIYSAFAAWALGSGPWPASLADIPLPNHDRS